MADIIRQLAVKTSAGAASATTYNIGSTAANVSYTAGTAGSTIGTTVQSALDYLNSNFLWKQIGHVSSLNVDISIPNTYNDIFILAAHTAAVPWEITTSILPNDIVQNATGGFNIFGGGFQQLVPYGLCTVSHAETGKIRLLQFHINGNPVSSNIYFQIMGR